MIAAVGMTHLDNTVSNGLGILVPTNAKLTVVVRLDDKIAIGALVYRRDQVVYNGALYTF